MKNNDQCDFEFCRDCGLACLNELLLADTEAVGCGGSVLISDNCSLQQNTTSRLELYFILFY